MRQAKLFRPELRIESNIPKQNIFDDLSLRNARIVLDNPGSNGDLSSMVAERKCSPIPPGASTR
jgi:hypothetical protein